METTYFEETQHFQWGFTLLPALISLMFGIMFLVQLILKIKIGNRPLPNWALLVLFLLTGAFSVFLGLQELKLKVTGKAIYFSLGALAPMQSVQTDEITSLHLRKYDGMAEFSGWGDKSNDKEQSYTASGDYGLEIKFKNSSRKSILIGTHEPGPLQAVLSKYFWGWGRASFKHFAGKAPSLSNKNECTPITGDPIYKPSLHFTSINRFRWLKISLHSLLSGLCSFDRPAVSNLLL